MNYEIVDLEYLASLEKNPKKRRLMTTKQWDHVNTKCVLSPMVEGTRPIFTKYKYDSQGKEMKERAPNPDGSQPQEEQSFFSKYWLYILIGFLVLPNLLGGPEEGGAAAPARK